MNHDSYEAEVREAVRIFWNARRKQGAPGRENDTGNRSSVTAGRQLDGFVQLLKSIAIDAGIPKDWIYTRGTTLPGFFRPTKNWDLLSSPIRMS